MEKRLFFKILIGLMVTTLFLAVLFKVQEFSFQSILLVFRKASPPLVLIAFLAIVVANIVRSIRFYLLIGEKQVHFKNVFASNNIYNLATASLPGGLGEALSVLIFSRYNAVRVTSAFSIIFISRLFDLLLFSVVIIAVLLLGVGINSPIYKTLFAACAVSLFISLLLLLRGVNSGIINFLALLAGHGAIGNRVRKILHEVGDGLACLDSPGKWATVCALSLLMVLISAASIHLVLLASGLKPSIEDTMIAFGIYAILQMVPVQGLGGLGTQNAWWTLALTSVGISRDAAVPASFFLHGVFYLFILGIAAVVGFPLAGKKK